MIKAGLVALGALIGSCGPGLAQAAPPPVPQPVLVDSTGKVIGPMYSDIIVALTLKSGQVILTEVARTGFSNRNRNPASYFYKTSNCSGQKLMMTNNVMIQTGISLAHLGNNTIVNAQATPRLELIASYGYYDISISGFRCGTYTPAEQFEVAPIVVTSIDSLGFTPPFKVISR